SPTGDSARILLNAGQSVAISGKLAPLPGIRGKSDHAAGSANEATHGEARVDRRGESTCSPRPQPQPPGDARAGRLRTGNARRHPSPPHAAGRKRGGGPRYVSEQS